MQVGKQKTCVTSFIAIFIMWSGTQRTVAPRYTCRMKKKSITDEFPGDQGQILQEWRWVKEKHMLLLSADLYTICAYSLSD